MDKEVGEQGKREMEMWERERDVGGQGNRDGDVGDG